MVSAVFSTSNEIKSLPFSIVNILSPEFGNKKNCEPNGHNLTTTTTTTSLHDKDVASCKSKSSSSVKSTKCSIKSSPSSSSSSSSPITTKPIKPTLSSSLTLSTTAATTTSSSSSASSLSSYLSSKSSLSKVSPLSGSTPPCIFSPISLTSSSSTSSPSPSSFSLKESLPHSYLTSSSSTTTSAIATAAAAAAAAASANAANAATSTSTTSSSSSLTRTNVNNNNNNKRSRDRDSPESDQPNYKKVRHSLDVSDSECSTISNSSSSVNPLPGNGWPAWVFCTRYSDRPSSGPRSRKLRKKEKKADEKRPRTAFTPEQLARLKQEFNDNKYLNEKRRQDLARDLKLNESQIKIWFQNKRAKIKKATGVRNPLQLCLKAQGLYNHSTLSKDGAEDDDDDDDDGDYLDDDKSSN